MCKSLWITGGSRGIGAAAVREFARTGWRVGFTYHDADQAAQALVHEIQAAGGVVIATQGDLRQRADAVRCFQQTRAALGTLDALVCNAGVAQQKMFCDLTDEDWNNMFASNVNSAFYCIQAALPDFISKKSGSIVTVSSVWGITGASCESHYASSKAALIGLTKSLAQELGLSGVRVNCVAPGVIDTDMNAMHDADTMTGLARETALGRIGQPDEVARTIRFLCSQDASFITGQVLGVSGGFMI